MPRLWKWRHQGRRKRPISSVITPTQAKAVFAHFIIGNTAATTYDDWVDDIQKAKAAHIDGFALNIAPLDTYMDNSLNNAYKAANAVGGFSLFLSFDFLSHGTWSNDNIIQHVNTYKDQPSQYRYNGQPFVSTFEGSDRVDDWASIKAATGCFFMPSWTSLQGNSFPTDKVDGAFSWDAWPHGPRDKNATTDETWQTILKGKPYMMGISPWFYTNIPEWSKNWLWRGDDLWHDRWQQVIELQPELVEIITWNDYGESHYIGPIRPGVPTGAQRYVEDMPHDHWRDILPHYIDAYKSGNTSTPAVATDAEKLTFWYRLNPSRSGSSGGTTGNSPTVNPNDPIYDPALVSQDKVFLTVLLASPADVSVQIGGGPATALRATTSGINHFSVPFNGQTGKVTFEVKRNGQCVVKAEGPPITAACAEGLVNWNAFVGGSS